MEKQGEQDGRDTQGTYGEQSRDVRGEEGSPGKLAKPHVVVIMADQLRYDVVNERYMPNVSRLKNESAVFERAYCASPLCVPARGAFFSGLYPNVNGSLINPWEQLEAEYGDVHPGTANMYSMMEADWDSWHTGKQHFNRKDIQQSCSRTHWHTLEDHYGDFLKQHGKRHPGGPAFKGIVPEMVAGTTTRIKRYSIPTTGCYEEGLDYFYDGYIAQTSLDAIRGRDRSKPLLLNAMFVAPHPPLDVPEPWYSMYKDEPIPDNVALWSYGQSPLQLYNLTGAIGNGYTKEQWRSIWQVYLGLVSLLDHCVGLIIDELKAQGIYDETLVILTSDHGEMLGSHRLYQKMCMYEESVRTPLFMKFPADSRVAPQTVEAPVSAVDIMPTLADYLQLEAETAFSGQSLLRLLRSGRQEADDEPGNSLMNRDLFIQFDGNGARGNFQRSVVRGARKLIVDMFKNELFLELYDVAEDPQEQRNLAIEQAHEEEIRSLLGSLSRHMEATNDLLKLPPDAYESFIASYSAFIKRP